MSPSPMKSAYLKIDRAAKHVIELGKLLQKSRAFVYVLETNTKTNRRSTLAKKDEAIVDEATIVAADALQNLRSALDHAYWQVVSPFASDPRSEGAVQFPFSKTSARLEEAVKNRLAHKVSAEFLTFILSLRPHGDAGGNELLYLLHDQNGVDKHRTLIPVGNYTRVSSELIRKQVPDFPPYLMDCTFGNNRRDVEWPLHPFIRRSLGLPGIPIGEILEQKLDVVVDVSFSYGGSRYLRPLVPTLHQLADITSDVVRRMERFV